MDGRYNVGVFNPGKEALVKPNEGYERKVEVAYQ
jgi:hypothetical protein